MGYEGDRLAPLFSSEPSRIAARRMAKRGNEVLLATTVQNTPIDDSPFPSRPPGTARRSWREKPVGVPRVSLREEVYETGIETEDDVAVYLEYGTGLWGPKHAKYPILPKTPGGMLSFYSRKTGEWVLAHAVMHPGIHPQRPLATGVALTEHVLPEMMQPILEEMVAAAELRARTAVKA